jgi:acetyltransferase-like isoleucine patch superfamily enzyme
MGKNVLIQPHCFFHCGGSAWSDGKGRISIGDHCWFGEYNILYGAGEIEIGHTTGTGPRVLIFSSRDNYSREYAELPEIVHEFGKVTIGSYVRIFANAVITPGISIGEGAVIGAGSVVTRDIPPWTVAVGLPARVIKDRERDTPLSRPKQN